jgi:AraC-like DNA-binding protein
MESVSTAGLPATGRLAAWNDLYSSRMSRVEFTPADHQRFDAELRIGRLGPVKLARLHVDRCSIERTRRHLAQSPRLYSFLMQARGSSVFCHYGHEARLAEGDFVLCDTGMPHHFDTGSASTTIMVRVTPEVLRDYLPTPEQFCGLRLGRAVGVTGTVAAMVQSLSERPGVGLGAEHEVRVARYLLEMLSMSYTVGFGFKSASTAVWRRRNDIVRFIEDNLHDPALTAESVAAGVHLSPRYLRAVFAGAGERVSAYILRRRLEESARRIRDPAWHGHTLMNIAFAQGFNSAAHFTRAFRERYGVSPREYRRAAPPRPAPDATATTEQLCPIPMS